MNISRLPVYFLISVMFAALTGCGIRSYPADNLKASLNKMVKNEYGIENVDVKIDGDTIGVFLPLKQLFAADFKEAAVTGKVRNLETLFEPSQEALEKVEDVLFSVSRVLLSTDKEFKFYVLQATDVEKTGLQLVLTGYVDDIRRVRIWDIPRSEYRKRVVHELRMNRAVKWHQPVHAFFNDIENLEAHQVRDRYFSEILPIEAIQTIFLGKLKASEPNAQQTDWNVLDIRSTPLQKNEVIVYVKVLPLDAGTPVNETTIVKDKTLQYLFTLSFTEEMARVRRIIPFQYQDENGQIKRIPFPKELNIEENLDKWDQEFSIENIEVGPFLADQLTRRSQALAAMDERIQNTFRSAQLKFTYVDDDKEKPPHFSLSVEASLSDFNHYHRDSIVFHEDMLYLLQMASREFVDVLRSYNFKEYNHLSLYFAQEMVPFVLGREDLELFRRKKVDFQGLLTPRQF